jgi:Family of unknown function (DUF6069)
MTRPIMPDDGPPQTRPVVDAKQLWVGGIFTAIVAALVALLGVLVCRWLFNIPLLSPQSQGTYGDAHTTDVVLLAAAAALLATGLAHLLLVAAPRPMTFFSWIVGLITLLLVLYPFSTSAPISQKIATAAVVLVIGAVIGSLTNGVAARAVRQRRVPPRDDYGQGPYDQGGYNQGGYGQSQWGPSNGRTRGPAN